MQNDLKNKTDIALLDIMKWCMEHSGKNGNIFYVMKYYSKMNLVVVQEKEWDGIRSDALREYTGSNSEILEVLYLLEEDYGYAE